MGDPALLTLSCSVSLQQDDSEASGTRTPSQQPGECFRGGGGARLCWGPWWV